MAIDVGREPNLIRAMVGLGIVNFCGFGFWFCEFLVGLGITNFLGLLLFMAMEVCFQFWFVVWVFGFVFGFLPF